MTRKIPNLSPFEMDLAERIVPIQCLRCNWTALEKLNGELLFYPPIYLRTFEIKAPHTTTTPACEFCLENQTV